MLAVINGDWQKAWEATKETIAIAIKAWVELLTASGTVLVGALKVALQALWDLSTWLHAQSFELGKMIVQGLIKGLFSMANPLGFAAKWVGDQVIDAIKARVQTQSPSKVTYQIGRWVAEGLVKGMVDSGNKVAAAADSTAKKLVDGLNEVVGGNLKDLVGNIFEIMSQGGQSFSDKLRNIFGTVVQSFRQMVSGMLKTWIEAKIFGTAGSGGVGGGGGRLVVAVAQWEAKRAQLAGCTALSCSSLSPALGIGRTRSDRSSAPW